ncbi:uncharacterized protein LOC105702342 [Orussus abietinus]|uniref:uncharacterized protein LOC105702342 n=1 Tax=Orussus abietinus TaxID=222816 RepID=UPI00062513EB|nr:uncharacterized protein LOC105702342 [Orussus abietinus]
MTLHQVQPTGKHPRSSPPTRLAEQCVRKPASSRHEPHEGKHGPARSRELRALPRPAPRPGTPGYYVSATGFPSSPDLGDTGTGRTNDAVTESRLGRGNWDERGDGNFRFATETFKTKRPEAWRLGPRERGAASPLASSKDAAPRREHEKSASETPVLGTLVDPPRRHPQREQRRQRQRRQ